MSRTSRGIAHKCKNKHHCNLLVSNWHFEVKLKKTKLHDFIEVSDERVEDAVDVWRVNEGEVW